MREIINFRKAPSGEVTSIIYNSITDAARAVGLTSQAISTAIFRGNNSPRGEESTWDYLFTGFGVTKHEQEAEGWGLE